MRELSLFTGSGGGLIATSIFLGIQTIGMVEYNEYCQKVLQKRQSENMLDQCPIFGDIREFIKQGFAESYKGMVDIITGGFPCQPHSVAGKRLAQDDERDLWGECERLLREVQPRWATFENVPGLLSSDSGRFFRRVLRDIAKAGYDACWFTFGAADVGAPHRRDRVFIVAKSTR